jgi:hypothetical protein
MIAALYVEKHGVYSDIPGVDAWDEARDARKYDGPWPVVAHPPCARWCRLAPVNLARYGLAIGDDGGVFAAALSAVRKFGGVLEHPASTLAWAAYGLPRPPRAGWQATLCGGWVCQVQQRRYGHRARKSTWLYAFGVDPPTVLWGEGEPPEAWVSTDRPCATMTVELMGKKERLSTPIAFRNLLCGIAASVTDR